MDELHKQDDNEKSKSNSTGKLSLLGAKNRMSLSSVTHPFTILPGIKFNCLSRFANAEEFLNSIPFRMDPNVEFSDDEEEYVRRENDDEQNATGENEDEQNATDENEDEQNATDENEDEQKNFDSCSALSDDEELSQKSDVREDLAKMSSCKESSQSSLGHAIFSGGVYRKTPYRLQATKSAIKERLSAQKVDENTISAFEWKPSNSAEGLRLTNFDAAQKRVPLKQITETVDPVISNISEYENDTPKLLVDPLLKFKKCMNPKINAIPRENHSYMISAPSSLQKRFDCTGKDVPDRQKEIDCTGKDVSDRQKEIDCTGKNVSDRQKKIDYTGKDVPDRPRKINCTGKDVPDRPRRFADYRKLSTVPSSRPVPKTNMPCSWDKELLPADSSSISSIKQTSDNYFAPPRYIPHENKSVSAQQCDPRKQIPREASIEKQHLIRSEVITVNNKPYTVLALLGKGGSCKVHSVYDQETKTVLALKLVDLDIKDSSVINGYKKEIEYLKMLQGSNRVIKMYDYEYLDNELRIVLEKGDTDLARVIAKEMKIKPLTPHTIKFYWSHMLEAVAEIHKFGIVHSDLKPANFLLVAGQLKLIDFGIAASVPMDMTSAFRETPMGTLSYMSPEAITNGESAVHYCDKSTVHQVCKVSTKSDVWSLGCILYNLVYGHTPFHNFPSMFQRTQAIVNPNYAIPFPQIDDLSLMNVLQSCLKRNPKERVTVEQLLNHPYLALEAKKKVSHRNHEPTKEFQDVLAQIEALTPRRMTVVSRVLQDLRLGQTSKR